MSDTEYESDNEAKKEGVRERKQQFSKPDYVMSGYRQKKHKFDESLSEFNVGLFEFTEWGQIKNKFMNQYLILEYLQRLFLERRYNTKYINQLYIFIQSKLKSKELKPADIVLENNVIKEITSLIILSENEYMLSVDEDADEEKGAPGLSAAAKLSTIHKLWNEKKKKHLIEH
jgi:hypothetical protein